MCQSLNPGVHHYIVYRLEINAKLQSQNPHWQWLTCTHITCIVEHEYYNLMCTCESMFLHVVVWNLCVHACACSCVVVHLSVCGVWVWYLAVAAMFLHQLGEILSFSSCDVAPLQSGHGCLLGQLCCRVIVLYKQWIHGHSLVVKANVIFTFKMCLNVCEVHLHKVLQDQCFGA